MATNASTADQLLDAQVRWVVDQLTGDQLAELVARDVDDVLAIAGELTLAEVVDVAEVKRIIRKVTDKVPASTTATTAVTAVADVAYDGPPQPVSASELIDRDNVESILDEMLGLLPLMEKILDEVAESPLVASLSARIVSRIVSDVLATNKAVADKIPGVGSLMSLGTSAAGKIAGAAQIDALLGDTAGKGAAFAARRLNKIAVDTMRDPQFKQAVLQIWDMNADKELGNVSTFATREDTHRLAGILQEVVASAVATEQAGALVDAVVDRFFAEYADHPVTALLDELDITRDDLVEDIAAVAPRVVAAAQRTGKLDGFVRDRLEPFFRTDEVAQILG